MKPRLIKRMNRWYCSHEWKQMEFFGTVYYMIPSQLKGFNTPEESYDDWNKKTKRKEFIAKIKKWFKGYFQ